MSATTKVGRKGRNRKLTDKPPFKSAFKEGGKHRGVIRSHADFMALWEAYIGSDRFHAPKVRYSEPSFTGSVIVTRLPSVTELRD